MPRDIGVLKRIDAREAWIHEAHQFTPWLRDNISLLGEKLGMDLDLVEIERPVGPFAADIVAKDVSGDRWVVIENQLAPTDHSHLGQLLTYGAGTEAKVFVWISPQFREEHRAALDWLNEHSGEDFMFFGVEIELIVIDDSRPAPYFKLVSLPNEWTKGRTPRGPVSERGAAYESFWGTLISAFKAKFPNDTNVSRPSRDNWLSLGIGRSGIGTNWVFRSGRKFWIELYIDTGDGPVNESYYSELERHKEEIEAALGHQLDWDPIKGKRAFRICSHYDGLVSVTDDKDSLRPLIVWAVDEMGAFRAVLRPLVKRLQTASKALANSPQHIE
jgi:hypothetical protein